ncbi:MAG: hypothetical protein ACO3XO_01330 [Bdellovibrionota bacterium]
MINVLNAKGRCLLISVLLVIGIECAADELSLNLNGHIKFQPTVEESRSDDIWRSSLSRSSELIDIRLNGEVRQEQFRFVLQGESFTISGKTRNAGINSATNLPGIVPINFLSDESRLFDLSSYSIEESKLISIQRIDRAYLEYSGEQFVLRAGRQAYTVGNGLVFQAIDLFAPFSPVEIDRDYKTGEDLLYLESILDDGVSLEVVTVPRRESGDVTFDAGSYGAILHYNLPQFGTNVQGLSAWHRGEWNYGLGSSTSISDSVVRFDILATRTANGEWKETFLFNCDTSWTLWEHNTYGFIEYYHNGFGSEQDFYSEMPEETLQRFLAGDVYVTGTEFLSAGVRVELHPLLQLLLTEIYALQDGSAFHQAQLQYDFLQDATLTLGVNIPTGGRGSEFGGRGVWFDEGETRYVRPTRSAYLRTSFFF